MSMQKDGSIRIASEDLSRGIGLSQFSGIGKIVNLDIFSQPGVVKIAKKLEAQDDITITERIRSLSVSSEIGNLYGLDFDGDLYQYSVGFSWSKPQGYGTTNDGLVVWKNYVLLFRQNASSITVDSYGPLNSPSKSTADITFNSNTSTNGQVPAHISIGDSLYVGAGRYLHTLTEVSGQDFDPTDSNTYTKEEEVLVLPEQYEITSIDQIGSLLILGTNYGDIETGGDIIIWDPNKAGADQSDADIRIQTGDSGIKNLVTQNGVAFVCSGNKGNIFITNTTQTQPLKRLNDVSRYPDVSFDEVSVGQNSCVHDGGIMFAFGKDNGDGDSDEPNIYYYKNGAWVSFTTSELETGDVIKIGAIKSISNDEYVVTWENETDSTFGADVLSQTKRYTNYSAYFESQFYSLGSNLRTKNYQNIGFRLAKPLATGQGIRIKYRESSDASWTTLKTYDYSNNGAITGYEEKSGLPSKLQNIQFRIEMTTGSGDNPGTPELLEFYAF